jgi:hypothetical protein
LMIPHCSSVKSDLYRFRMANPQGNCTSLEGGLGENLLKESRVPASS